MLTLEQIIDHVLVESGQFFDSLESTMLDKHKIEMLVIRELKYYSKYKPKQIKFNAYLENYKEFTIAKDGHIPEHITNIRYTHQSGTDPMASLIFRGARRSVGSSLNTFYWRYEKPILIMRGTPGEYTISAITSHYYDKLTSEIRTLDDSSYDFLNLITAKFMIALGRSRRAFSIGEIPFNSDASELVSEGQQLLSESRDRIETTSNFHLAVLP